MEGRKWSSMSEMEAARSSVRCRNELAAARQSPSITGSILGCREFFLENLEVGGFAAGKSLQQGSGHQGKV